MECFAYLRNVTDLLSDGKTPNERRFGATIWGTYYSTWFIGWVLPCHCEGPVQNPLIWKESLTWIVPWIRSVRGGNLKGWRTDRRPWGVGDDGRIGNLLEKTQCERGDITQRKREHIFPIADGRIKTPGGDQELRTSTLIRPRPIQGESNIDFLGESEGSLPPPHDSLPVAGEAMNDFWSMSWSFIYRHHVEPRVKLYSPREESFPIPLKYIDVSRNYSYEFGCQAGKNASMIIGISMVQEICLNLGQVSLSLLQEEKTTNEYMWSGWRLTRKQLTSRPDHLWPELLEKMGKNTKLKEKQKWTQKKNLGLENARKLRRHSPWRQGI